MEPTRRSFLMGGRLFGGPWPRFCHRLSRVVRGQVTDQTTGRDDPGTALLTPVRREDVYHARALCAELHVAIALSGTRVTTKGPVLWVDPSRLCTLTEDGEHWQAEAGVPVGELRQRGLLPVDSQADATPVSVWLATVAEPWASALVRNPGGLVAADVLLFDGQSDRLGPFGASTTGRPLGLALRDIVTELFRLSQRPQLQGWRERPTWPARYRLDALWQSEPNLARLLIAAQGTLAWLETTTWSRWQDAAMPPAWAEPSALSAADWTLRVWVEQQVKDSCDPHGALADLPAERRQDH